MKILELTKNSTSGIKYIEQVGSLSEWAVEFVERENITRESVKTSAKFHELPRREKDAVRYQLKKLKGTKLPNRRHRNPNGAASFRPISSTATRPAFLKIGLGIWIAGFLLNDIVVIYVSKGLSPLVAWQAAVLVELCILIGSLGESVRLQKLTYGLVLYNALVFGTAEVGDVLKHIENSTVTAETIRLKAADLTELRGQLSDGAKEKRKNYARIESLISEGYVSIGTQAFEKMANSISKSETTLRSNIEEIEQQTERLNNQQKSVTIVIFTGILYFFLRCLLQIFSVWLIKGRRD